MNNNKVLVKPPVNIIKPKNIVFISEYDSRINSLDLEFLKAKPSYIIDNVYANKDIFILFLNAAGE